MKKTRCSTKIDWASRLVPISKLTLYNFIINNPDREKQIIKMLREVCLR